MSNNSEVLLPQLTNIIDATIDSRNASLNDTQLKEGYLGRSERKKILLLSDDL